jgi:SAP domain-containing ribonucleoprotein
LQKTALWLSQCATFEHGMTTYDYRKSNFSKCCARCSILSSRASPFPATSIFKSNKSFQSDLRTGMVDIAELKKKKVTELRDELSSRGLDTKGVKDDLIARLAAAISAEEEAPASPPAAEGEPQLATEAEVPELAIEPPSSVAPAQPPLAPAASAEEPAAAGTAPAAANKPALTEAEKTKLRAERFGLPLKSDKTGAAPAAVGAKSAISGLGHVDPEEEFARRRKRAERFGLPIPVNKAELEAKKKARAERFGLPVSISKEELEAKKKARAERFGTESKEKGNGAAGTGKPAGAGAAAAPVLSEEERRRREERAKRFAAQPTA